MSINDLVRSAVFLSNFGESLSCPLFIIKEKDVNIAQILYPIESNKDFPFTLIIFVVVSSNITGSYIRYIYMEEEKIEIRDDTAYAEGFYLPLIRLKKINSHIDCIRENKDDDIIDEDWKIKHFNRVEILTFESLIDFLKYVNSNSKTIIPISFFDISMSNDILFAIQYLASTKTLYILSTNLDKGLSEDEKFLTLDIRERKPYFKKGINSSITEFIPIIHIRKTPKWLKKQIELTIV